MLEEINQSCEFIQSKLPATPLVAIVLGSGLGKLAEEIENKVIIEYKDIPNFKQSTVIGHEGRLIFGKLGGKDVIAMQGRLHYYEGYSMQEICFPVRVFKQLGAEYLFVSNAAGGLNPDFKAGDLMLINDHINFFPENPLRGKNIDEFGPRFPDMSKTYFPPLLEKARKIAEKNSILLKEGIYIGSSGPTLETPAEYRMFRILGADATGMSTVPEIIVAHHCGMKCFGISVITNESEPADPSKITTHDEVLEVAEKAESNLTKIFTDIIESI